MDATPHGTETTQIAANAGSATANGPIGLVLIGHAADVHPEAIPDQDGIDGGPLSPDDGSSAASQHLGVLE